jgi:Ca2+-transporting ATPase
LQLCDSIRVDGRKKRITEVVRKGIESAIHDMSRKSLRVLVCGVIENYQGAFGVDEIKGLTFASVYGMRDVLRQGVKESIEEARTLGLRVIMITGDHRDTAESIAREAGIFREGDHVLSDTDFLNMSETELLAKLPQTTVFARITPEHKFTIIELFRKRGDIIAMTGDGVNDSLSLAAADLGIAMGKGGTEVSKEAADIVLLDDNFRSIVLAIEEGRNMYRGIKKVIAYLFSTGIGELLTILGAMLLFLPMPFVPTQILWLNLVTDGFLVVALAMEPGEKVSGSKNAAKFRKKNFFDKEMVTRTAVMGIVMSLGSVLLFYMFHSVDPIRASTIALTSLAMFQWWNAWNVKSEQNSLSLVSLAGNKYLIGATALVVILQLFAVYNPIMQKILVTVPLTLMELYIAFVVSLSIIGVEEIRKLIYRKYS